MPLSWNVMSLPAVRKTLAAPLLLATKPNEATTMTIDPELVRDILKDTEAIPAKDFPIQGYSYEGRDNFEIAAHVKQLINAGYLEGNVQSDNQNRPIRVAVFGLTILGQNFLSKAKSPTVWRQAVTKVSALGGGVALDVLKVVLEKITTSELGL